MKRLLFFLFLLTPSLVWTETQLSVSSPPYQRLEEAQKRYKKMASQGGWIKIPEGPKIKLGDKDHRIPQVARHLALIGDFKGRKAGTVFDDSLEQAVRRFQRRHGLDEDGVIGTQVMSALNVSPSERLHQIELNLERLRQVSPPLSDQPYIRVNIPDFRLEIFEHDRSILEMRVVVGLEKEWQTPSLSSQISHLILNPKWHVPPKIFQKELLEKIQKDPMYLENENMKLYRGNGDTAEEVDTKDFKWNEEEINGLHLIQGEGRGNALGRLKFMFKNPFDIYLHDTPQQPFFKKRVRTFSHGCIRVEKPMELAEYILKEDPRWPYDKFVTELEKGKNKHLRLQQPVPLHILYLTAWVDPDGIVQFREDVYGWDEK